ncbi:hypothetical protein BH09GEM1_BH09GEM1_42230 [soil metagenome]
MRDDRQRIAALADERSLELEHETCEKVRSDLLNPRNRLAVEVAWLPGVSPRRAAQLLERLTADPRGAERVEGLPTLARANILAAAIEASSGGDTPAVLAARLVELARESAAVDAGDVLRDINEDRTIARLPLVQSGDQVAQELAERERYYRTVLRNALDHLPAEQLVATATQAIATATEKGEVAAPPLIDGLVDVYELESQAFLTAEAENISKLIAAIRAAAPHGDVGVVPLIAKLASVARNWDAVAQPVQVGLRARGTEHELSRKMGGAIRSLAVDLYNEHQMLSAARRLTDLLRDVFAELPEFAERLEEDADALEELEAGQAASKDKRRVWAREISYRADIGMVLKDVLSISPDGVSWKGRSYPLDAINRVRWGATRHSVNGIPTGTTYMIGFGDAQSEAVVESRRAEVYEAFVERLWKAVGVRLLLDTLRDLKAGKEWWIAETRIRDDSIIFYRSLAWKCEPVAVPWSKIRHWDEAGLLKLAVTDEPQLNVTLSYRTTVNAHVLDRILTSAKKRTGLRRLSELLN